MDPAFIELCQQHGLEPTDERYFFWLSGRLSQTEDPPAAWACFGADGELLGLLDALPPGMRPRPVPLYRRPVGQFKPQLPPSLIKLVWSNYDGCVESFTRWVEAWTRGEL